MFVPPRIPARFVAHPRHGFGFGFGLGLGLGFGFGFGCGSLRAIRARMRASAFTPTYLTDY
jgi:hypothetical protein